MGGHLGAAGAHYLIGLGLVCVLFARLLPHGIWGEFERRFGVQLLPVGYRLDGLPAQRPVSRKLSPP